MQVHRERDDHQQAKPSEETKALLSTTDPPLRVADRDLHHVGDLLVDLVLNQRNCQLELTLVSTYLVRDFPFCYSH